MLLQVETWRIDKRPHAALMRPSLANAGDQMFKAKRTTDTTASIATPVLRVAFATLLAGMIAAPWSAFAQSSTPAPGSSTAVTPKPKRTPTPGQIAARERQKKCAAEWKVAKDAGKIEKGMKWPRFWSACNKRLKGTST